MSEKFPLWAEVGITVAIFCLTLAFIRWMGCAA
jgi:hypothetical protein